MLKVRKELEATYGDVSLTAMRKINALGKLMRVNVEQLKVEESTIR